MSEYVVLRTVVRILFPFILLYGIYIQFHGDYSAGGGFQAGIIFAAGFIAYGLVHDLNSLQEILPDYIVRCLSAAGLLIYIGVGVACMINGGHFLEYNVLASDPIHGQHLGVMLVELGVGITVFSVMILIFYVFGERSS